MVQRELTGPLPNDTSTAVCGFYEVLPKNEERWPNFAKWFSATEFDQLRPAFAYHLEPCGYGSLASSVREVPLESQWEVAFCQFMAPKGEGLWGLLAAPR